jgi:hypothetical protein
MKHYFLFGEAACFDYGNGGTDGVIAAINNEETTEEFSLFVFEDGVTAPVDLLYAYSGNGDYSCITEEDYNRLLEYQ